MTFTRANPLGFQAGEDFSHTDANHIDLNQSRAVDGYAGGTYSPTDMLTWNEGFKADATGSTETNRIGVYGIGKGTGEGGYFESGSGASRAVYGVAYTASNAAGGYFVGDGNGEGVYGESEYGYGVRGYKTGTGNAAVEGACASGATGAALSGNSYYGGGYALDTYAMLNSPTKACIRIRPQNDEPSSLDDGATWIIGKRSYQRLSGVTQVLNPVVAWINFDTLAVTGIVVCSGEKYNIDEEIGTHTGGNGASSLTDSTQSWSTDALVDFCVFNKTQEEYGLITANTATNVTASMSGGGTWDTGDEYEIVHARIVSNNTMRIYFRDPVASFSSNYYATAMGFANSPDSNDNVGSVYVHTDGTYFDVSFYDISDTALVNFNTRGALFSAMVLGELA